MKRAPEYDHVDHYIAHRPRIHDLVRLDDGSIVEQGLTEYQMFQKLRLWDRHPLYEAPAYEVHYVNQEGELAVKEAGRWLYEREREYDRSAPPINIGSRWADSDGPEFEVLDICIDEDGEAQALIQEESGRSLSVSAEDIHNRARKREITPIHD